MSSPRLDLAVKMQAWRLRELLKWREYVKALVESAIEVFGGDIEIYLFGSVLEGRLTVDSDIDVAVVLREVPKRGLERARLLDALWRGMEFRGVPWWYPFEIHLVTQEELTLLKETKLNKIY
ncbi:MAG: nucleotidyltransferase domain-containing protein [Thermosphaera sp.]|jgi:predicted nucleotidyltransferase|nr:nucleotidyltransferase domain-containing protein [Thermosphaera sp.]